MQLERFHGSTTQQPTINKPSKKRKTAESLEPVPVQQTLQEMKQILPSIVQHQSVHSVMTHESLTKQTCVHQNEASDRDDDEFSISPIRLFT